MAVDLPEDTGPGWFTRARLAFRYWRRNRPFWGGFFLILGGLELFASGNLQPANFQIHLGVEGFLGYLVPTIILLCAVLGWFTPSQRMFYGILGVLASLYSLISVNLGGFLFGMLLGIIGGSMMVAWVPRRRTDGPVEIEAAEPAGPDATDTQPIQPVTDEYADDGPVSADEIGAEGKQGERFPGPRHAAPDRVTRTAIALVVAVALTGGAGLIALQNPTAAAAADCVPPPTLSQLVKSAKPKTAAKHATKTGAAKSGTATSGTAKSGTAKIGAAKTGTAKTGAATTGSAESGTANAGSVSTKTAAGGRGAATSAGKAAAVTAGSGKTAGSAKASAGNGTQPADDGSGGGILGGIIGGIGTLLGGDPSPSPSPSTSPKPSPSAKPSPSTKPSSSPTPSTKPSTSTGPNPSTPPSGSTASPTATPTPTVTCAVRPNRVAAAGGQVTVEATPAIQTASLLTMTNVSYVGNVSLPIKGGTLEAMEFTMDSSTSTPFELDVTTNGHVTKSKTSKLTVSGHVIFYTTEIKGNALGILPQDYTPSNPPPLVPPDVFFTDVTIHLIDVQCDLLTTAKDFTES